MTTARTALITGANQGLGFALAEGLAARLDPTDRVVLTGRDPARVADAVERIGGGGAHVDGHVLDVRDGAAITSLAASLGAVDILFSNAAARSTPDVPAAEAIDAVAETSNLATTRILRAFAARVRPGGRLIVVASSLGTLGRLEPAARRRVMDAGTLEGVEALTDAWSAAVRAGRAGAEGWPAWTNIPSKVLQVAAVRAVATARRDRDLADGILLAAVCPGLIDTGASRPWFSDMSDAQTPAQAAGSLLDLALSPAFDPATYGELIRFGRVVPWTGTSASAHSA